MLKKLSLLSFVIILIIIAWYFVNKSNSVVSSSDFIIEDTSLINKIIIEDKNKSLKMERYQNNWVLNDTFQVNNGLLRRFFVVFSSLNLIAPISNNSRDTVINNLNVSGTKVSFFSKNTLLKEYLLGSLNSSESGNIILLNKEKLAVISSILFVHDLNDIVSTNSLLWRNKMIFNKNTSHIIHVLHKNILHKEKSYAIRADKNKFTLLNHTNKPVVNFKEKAIARYLSYFQNIKFEKIETSLTSEQKDSILEFNHAHTIIILDDRNVKYELNLYLKPEKISNTRMSKEFDLNRIYGKMNNEENILIFEYYIIDPILKDISYFVKKII